MTLSFYLDNDVDVSCAAVFHDAGHQCWTASQAATQTDDDDEQTVYATDRGAVLVTHDAEFTTRRKKLPIGRHVRLACHQLDTPELLRRSMTETRGIPRRLPKHGVRDSPWSRRRERDQGLVWYRRQQTFVAVIGLGGSYRPVALTITFAAMLEPVCPRTPAASERLSSRFAGHRIHRHRHRHRHRRRPRADAGRTERSRHRVAAATRPPGERRPVIHVAATGRGSTPSRTSDIRVPGRVVSRPASAATRVRGRAGALP